MNKVEIINKIRESGITNYVIGHSAALVMYGVCDTCRDIDMQVSPIEFERLLAKGLLCMIHQRTADRFIPNFVKSLDVFESKYFDSDKIQIVEGINCLSLDDIKSNYILSNRPKDLEKIDMINNFLK